MVYLYQNYKTVYKSKYFTPIKPDNRIILFCFHHAGGSASFFRNWESRLSTSVFNIVPIQLSGREERIKEPFITDMTILVNEIIYDFMPIIRKYKYAFLGHSMGSLIAYEISYQLEKLSENKKINLPLFITLSSVEPPYFPLKMNLNPSESDEIFLKQLINYGNIPDAMLDYPEIIGELIKRAKADVILIQSYTKIFDQEKRFINKSKLILFLSNNDKTIDIENVFQWENYGIVISKKIFNGTHFYINDNFLNIIKILEKINIS